MPQEDHGAGKVDHTHEVFQGVFPPDGDSAEVTAQGAPVLGTILSVAPMRSDHFDSGFGQFLVKAVGIIGIVLSGFEIIAAWITILSSAAPIPSPFPIFKALLDAGAPVD